MKKLMLIVGLSLLGSGLSQAACVGPFCWDDTGASVAGSVENGNGDALPQITKAQALTFKPDVKGQEVWCTDCNKFNGGLGMPCIATATVVASYIAVASGTAVTVCQ